MLIKLFIAFFVLSIYDKNDIITIQRPSFSPKELIRIISSSFFTKKNNNCTKFNLLLLPCAAREEEFELNIRVKCVYRGRE